MLCPDCHSYCENDDEHSFGIFIRDSSGDFVVISSPFVGCFLFLYERVLLFADCFDIFPFFLLAQHPMHRKEPVQPEEWLEFKAHGRRYVVYVFIGHSTTLIGGDGKIVVFDMSARMPQAYVCYVGSGLAADHGGATQDMTAGDVAQGGGGKGGAGNFAVHGVEEVNNAGHGVEVAPDIIYTRGLVLSDGEAQMLGLVITIEDGYIGPHYVHRLTPTNITSKFMKIPKKIVQPLNFSREGVIGLCMVVGDLMQLGYHMTDGLRQRLGCFCSPEPPPGGRCCHFQLKQSNA
ncbi:hypothetical protein VPH35_131161 [Triticum aestivum]